MYFYWAIILSSRSSASYKCCSTPGSIIKLYCTVLLARLQTFQPVDSGQLKVSKKPHLKCNYRDNLCNYIKFIYHADKYWNDERGKGLLWVWRGQSRVWCVWGVKGTIWKYSMNDKWHERKYEKGSSKKRKREYIERNTAKEIMRKQMYREGLKGSKAELSRWQKESSRLNEIIS